MFFKAGKEWLLTVDSSLGAAYGREKEATGSDV
jgi:hypothetical protein